VAHQMTRRGWFLPARSEPRSSVAILSRPSPLSPLRRQLPFCWLDRAERMMLKAFWPRSGKEHGAFAIRPSNRPDPIGTRIVEHLEYEGKNPMARGSRRDRGLAAHRLPIPASPRSIGSCAPQLDGGGDSVRREGGAERRRTWDFGGLVPLSILIFRITFCGLDLDSFVRLF